MPCRDHEKPGHESDWAFFVAPRAFPYVIPDLIHVIHGPLARHPGLDPGSLA